MANSRTLSYDALVTTTLDNLHKSGKLTDLVQNSNPTFAWMKQHARTSVDGGHQVRIPVMTGLADNVDSMSPWGDINLTPQEGITTYFDNWALYSGAVTITGTEERTNRGRAAIISLIKEKVYQLTGGFAERMNKDLWYLGTLNSANAADTTGNGDLDIKSIPIILPVYTGAQSGKNADINYLGIDETYWKPKLKDLTGSSVSTINLLHYLRTLFLDCSKKQGGAPDLAICDYMSFALYQSALDTKVRYVDTKMADMGFTNVKLEGCTLFPDVYVPDPDTGTQSAAAGGANALGAFYLLNTKTWSLKTMSGADFQPGVYEKIQGKDAKSAPYIWQGQLVCDNPQKNGVAFSMPTAVTA